MITEEELEKLIKNREEVYAVTKTVDIELEDIDIYYEVEVIQPSNYDYIEDGKLIYSFRMTPDSMQTARYELTNLYKTKDEAEFALEFGNITRTETLKLPTWEELKDVKTRLYEPVRFTIDFNKYEIEISKCGSAIYYKTLVINTPMYENVYIKACRIAKDLFLGE